MGLEIGSVLFEVQKRVSVAEEETRDGCVISVFEVLDDRR